LKIVNFSKYISNLEIGRCLKLLDNEIDKLKWTIYIHDNRWTYYKSLPKLLYLVDPIGSIKDSFDCDGLTNFMYKRIDVFNYHFQCFDCPKEDSKYDMIKLHIISTLLHEFLHIEIEEKGKELSDKKEEKIVLRKEKKKVKADWNQIIDILNVKIKCTVNDLDDCSFCEHLYYPREK
jgi:hypothetical protein